MYTKGLGQLFNIPNYVEALKYFNLVIENETKNKKNNKKEEKNRDYFVFSNTSNNFIAIGNHFEESDNLALNSKNNAYTLAKNNIGVIYEIGGYGVEQDYKKALYYYELAAKDDCETAYCNIANIYKYGRGVKIDIKKAADYYKISADKGFPLAQNKIGRIYELGE